MLCCYDYPVYKSVFLTNPVFETPLLCFIEFGSVIFCSNLYGVSAVLSFILLNKVNFYAIHWQHIKQ